MAAKHGIKALVVALGGGTELGALGRDITSALLAGESKLAERFDDIDRQLEEVLDQRFSVEMATGSRLLLDALDSYGQQRSADLERSRQHLLQASAAARSHLQRARAERHLLLACLMLGWTSLASRALITMESAALLALMEAQTGTTETASARVMTDRSSITMLAEAAAFATALSLPKRNLERLVGLGLDNDARPTRWIAISAADEPMRIGPMRAQFSWSPNSSPLPPGFSLASYPSPAGGVLREPYLTEAARHRPAALHISFDVPLAVDHMIKVGWSSGKYWRAPAGSTALEVPIGEALQSFYFMAVNMPYETVKLGIPVIQNGEVAYINGIELIPGPRSSE